MLVATEPKKLAFYRNVGTAKAPKLGPAVEIALKGDGFEKGYRNRIEVATFIEDRNRRHFSFSGSVPFLLLLLL